MIAGQSPKSSFYNEQGQGLPFYQGKKEFTDRLIDQPTKWTTSVTKTAESGDILMSVRAPVGPINQATEKICIGRGLAAIRPREILNRDYLWYALSWLQPTIKGSAGAVFENINKATIELLRIPVPSPEEQRRIVAVLDDAIDGLNRARAYAETNLQDARELFQSIVVVQLVNSRWPTKTLGQVATIVNGGTPRSKLAEYWGGSAQWLTPKDMGCMAGREIGKTPRTITELGLANSAARLIPEKSVILSTRAPIGHLAINALPMAFSQGCRGLVPKEGLDHLFLYYFLYANRLALQELGTGTTFRELSASNLKSFQIVLPPPEEQRRIIAALDEAFKSTEQLAGEYQTSHKDLIDLRQSLLQRAFAGELT